MTTRHNTLVNAVLSQHNWIVITTGILAFVFTCLKLYTIFIDIPKLDSSNLDEGLLLKDVVGVLLLAILGFILYVIPHTQVLNRQFKLRETKKSLFFRNCNLNKKRFSLLYKAYIDYNTLKLRMGIKQFQVTRFLLLLLCSALTFLGILFLV